MRRHRCTGSADTCPVCAQRRDGIEAGPLTSDFEAATRAAEDRFERHGEPRRQPAPMTRGEDASDWLDERRQTRRLREFMQRRTA